MSRRVNLEQRQKLFAFMICHQDLARGRVSGPDAARLKQAKLEKLAIELNAFGSGATKTPEKWLKCWQDWKCDVKAKHLKIKKARSGTGGGPSPAPLSPLEEELLQFFGVEMAEGLTGVADPLEVIENAIVEDEEAEPMAVEEDMASTTAIGSNEKDSDKKRHKSDPLNETLDRQAAAIEDVAAAIREMAAALQQIAFALQPARP